MWTGRGRRADGRAVRKWLAVFGSTVFLVVPGVVVGVVPWWISGWRLHAPLFGVPASRALGVLLVVLGIPVLLESFVRFALDGLGTPAPIFPTRHLVIRGPYRYVRNPIYLAGVSIILGQAGILGNLNLIAYALLVWLGIHAFAILYEEPTLRESFGAQYDGYCAAVPRWVPRRPALRLGAGSGR